MWWAEGEFRKMKVLPEGGTLADAFVSYRRQTGKPHPQDRDYVTPPDELAYLYDWFWQVAQGRPIGPEGMMLPVPSVELRAWSELAGVRLEDWELTGLRALDATFIRVAAEKGV